MTTTFMLIRHASHGLLGRTLCGRMPGVSLDEAGRRQAASLAKAIARSGVKVDALYASPLERARETAEPIGAALDLNVKVHLDLDELDFGAWSGCAFDDLGADARWIDWNRERDHVRPPGGETMAEAQLRIAALLERLESRHPRAVVALVSHGDMIKAALAWALGLPLAFYGRFEVAPASLSRLTVGPSGAKVWSINEKPAE